MTIEQLREELRWLRDKLAVEPWYLERVALHKRITAVEEKIAWVTEDRRNHEAHWRRGPVAGCASCDFNAAEDERIEQLARSYMHGVLTPSEANAFEEMLFEKGPRR